MICKIKICISIFCCLCLGFFGNTQSFEQLNIDHLTTTPSASRSANFVDVNGDNWDDIFISNGLSTGQNNMLYINNQDGTFTTVLNEDIALDGDRSDGASFADADNDGDLDGFVVTYGAGGVGRKNYFYRNNGAGGFDYEPDIAMGTVLTYSEMATWVDVNNDQLLDVYLTNSRVDLKNQYYENQGDGSFEPVNNLNITGENLYSRSIDWIDYDNDGDSDLFITNEEGAKNSLFRNDGPDNFTAITDLAFLLEGKNTAGSSWADVDNDGDFDLFIANWGGVKNQLFINEDGVFTERPNSAISEGIGSSFGSTFGDLDNDGDVDLIVCNAYFAGQLKNSIFMNDGQGNFTQDNTSALALQEGNTFGCALGDYDNNGWLDVILANTLSENQTNSFFKNTGTGNNWIKILCKGTTSNASAVGAKLKITTTQNGVMTEQYRIVAASSGYCSQNSFTVHFGLAAADHIDELQITWPSGTIEYFNEVMINSFHSIEEGKGISSTENQGLRAPLISIYPNPSSNAMHIELKGEYQDSATLELFDLKGKRVINYNFDPSFVNTLQKGQLSAGGYILRVKVADEVVTNKIIFQE